ncbi:long-chain fatty acid--CoA ligase [Nocardioides sp. zg-ZUI104]|uniref:AMP-dependent synthetase/ligase n=1 Tax=Nocardioides faecalis TaxID=2803858 RepID=UPI001BD1A80F|nr:long-chain fatty acid--CoA ligase [Nocardioides faecalis]MBS4753115.1 long-chain fatty acid--CoA ligase [Nocardioides faecalis]
MTATPRTLCEAFARTCVAHPDKVALRDHAGRLALTWREYSEQVQALATGLSGLGVRRGDTVALMMGNRPEFHLVDTAVLHLGAIPFSVYNTLAADQVTYVFSNAENTVVICEPEYLDKIRTADTTGQVKHIVCLEPTDPAAVADVDRSGTLTLAELAATPDPDFDFEASWRAVEPSDLATIIYTSGTTGPPKGVESTHANVIAEFSALDAYLATGPEDVIISYLPDAHIANRGACHYNSLIRGIEIVTVDNPKALITALPAVRPTVHIAVPAIWYKVKAGLENTLAAETGLKAKLAQWAVATGGKVAQARTTGQPVSPLLRVQHVVADKLVLSKVRAKVGLDRMRIAVTGAAPISPDALAFIMGLGLEVCEMWGMSETSGAVTVNPPGKVKLGTVGTVLPGGTEIKRAVDGELLVRGPLVMKGYRDEPEKTAEAIDADGWLHTGDIASIDAEGYVKIVDRKKEIIINAAGKNMSPSNIEGAIKVACPLVLTAVAIGDDKPYVSALLTLDPDACAAYAAAHGLPDGSVAALAGDPGVQKLLEAGIAQANAKLARVEQVKKFKVLADVWEPGGGELTPTMKLKRRPIADKYAEAIEELYRK